MDGKVLLVDLEEGLKGHERPEELWDEDGQHLSPEGYSFLATLIAQQLLL